MTEPKQVLLDKTFARLEEAAVNGGPPPALDGILHLIVAKNKDGMVGTIPVRFAESLQSATGMERTSVFEDVA
jgi:replicative DNA helicase